MENPQEEVNATNISCILLPLPQRLLFVCLSENKSSERILSFWKCSIKIDDVLHSRGILRFDTSKA